MHQLPAKLEPDVARDEYDIEIANLVVTKSHHAKGDRVDPPEG